MSESLYHLATPLDWERCSGDGEYRADSLASEGFIHLSTGKQVLRSAARFFGEAADLLLIEVDRSALADALRFEAADGEMFPHLYAPLPLSAVLRQVSLERDASGAWSWPR